MERLPDGLADGGMLLVEHHLRTSAPVGGPRPAARSGSRRTSSSTFSAGRLRVLYHDERIAPDPDGRDMALTRFLGCRGSPGF